MTYWGHSVLEFQLQIRALIPTSLHDNKISMPQVRRSLVVSKTRRRFNSTLPLWTTPLPSKRATGRDYHTVLRCACTRRNTTIEGHQDLQMLVGSSKRSPRDNQNRGNSKTNWITRQRNGIAGRHTHGQGTVGTCKCKKRSLRGIDLATDSRGTKTIRD